MTPHEASTPGAAGSPLRPPALERYVRAALAGTATALLGGLVVAQYVGAGLYAALTPLVLGVLTAAAVQAATGEGRSGPDAVRVRPVAAAYALLGVALGLRLERSTGLLDPAALLPYGCAVAGVLLWTLPPRR